jgi:hypothetical protein
MSISDQLREAAKKWNGENLETFLSTPAAEALAEEADTTTFLLDMVSESIDMKELMLKAADKLEAKEKRDREPKPIDLVLGGQDWGQVAIPPELLRGMWRIGETLGLFLEKKIPKEQYEKEILNTIEIAREWVCSCKGIKPDRDLINIEVMPIEAQEKLRQLNSSEKPKGGDPPF